jgi:hypothetical protein
MENLLKNSFIAHYQLPPCEALQLAIQTQEAYFEIEEDTSTQELRIHQLRGSGTARFSNPKKIKITVVNYEKFLNSLPNDFQRGQERCDMIVVCNTDAHFILGELKDSPDIKGHRKKAKKQLVASLLLLKDVPEILAIMNSKIAKKCCYFNKHSKAPELITAISAFNRLASLFPDGLQMSHESIENQNFEFWEYVGEQTVSL